MEVHKAPFQEESRLSMGLCAQSHVSRWEGSSWAWGWGLREGGGGGHQGGGAKVLGQVPLMGRSHRREDSVPPGDSVCHGVEGPCWLLTIRRFR